MCLEISRIVWQLVHEFQVVHIVSDVQINVLKQLWKTVMAKQYWFWMCRNNQQRDFQNGAFCLLLFISSHQHGYHLLLFPFLLWCRAGITSLCTAVTILSEQLHLETSARSDTVNIIICLIWLLWFDGGFFCDLPTNENLVDWDYSHRLTFGRLLGGSPRKHIYSKYKTHG